MDHGINYSFAERLGRIFPPILALDVAYLRAATDMLMDKDQYVLNCLYRVLIKFSVIFNVSSVHASEAARLNPCIWKCTHAVAPKKN